MTLNQVADVGPLPDVFETLLLRDSGSNTQNTNDLGYAAEQLVLIECTSTMHASNIHSSRASAFMA